MYIYCHRRALEMTSFLERHIEYCTFKYVLDYGICTDYVELRGIIIWELKKKEAFF